ncbi:MAG: hypothetical protein MUO72_09370 [Bacteroidales bacterium]|nr:hypothetical protein [Bacteroidales bacterium]
MKKIFEYLKIGIKAIGKFLKYTYASNIICLFEAVLIGLCISEFLGVIFVLLSLILWLNDYKQQKIDKPTTE